CARTFRLFTLLSVVVTLTLALVVLEIGLASGLRHAVPYVQRAPALLLLIVRTSIVGYWAPRCEHLVAWT
ncbi:MAG TPA: hypothetical protein VNE17_03840, partial [Nitrolancea sp.]|nr:hypothetical protein [Nitrolancea sp.]